VFSNLPMLRLFGWLSALAMLLALIADLTPAAHDHVSAILAARADDEALRGMRHSNARRDATGVDSETGQQHVQVQVMEAGRLLHNIFAV